jgi:hypothetical protein
MRRLGFVSNSSSTSFVVPKKYLTKDELEIYNTHADGYTTYDEELYSSEHYIYGKVSMHNSELGRILNKYSQNEDVDYYD